MLVSYQVTGGRLNNDNACISLVEFDVRTNEIKPNNFIINMLILKNTYFDFKLIL